MEDIDWSCPADLKPYEDAHWMERDEKDIIQWQLGQYFAAAVSCMFPKGKYPKQAMFQSEKISKTNRNKESKEAVAVFEMSQRIKILGQQGLKESPA